jgi:hypothetical protein
MAWLIHDPRISPKMQNPQPHAVGFLVGGDQMAVTATRNRHLYGIINLILQTRNVEVLEI